MTRLSIILTIVLLTLLGHICANAQTELPKKIKISKGQRVHWDEINGYDIYYSNELEYNLKDSVFRFRWKPKKPFIDLKTKPTEIFINPSTYKSLDSLFNKFTEYKFQPGGKPSIYRIELVYCNDK